MKTPISITILASMLVFFLACKKEEPLLPPTLSTLAVIEVGSSSAKSGGNITTDGGSAVTSRGVVWAAISNPTLETNQGLNTEGSGLGVFQSTITGLTPSTTYYVRAYATNSAGTGYGSQVSFTTSGGSSGEYPDGFVHCGTPTAVVDVTNPATGKIWMDRNLGASQVATSSSDAASYGDLYQWGRFADGHQCRNSPITTTLSNSDQPGHGSFILAHNSPWDWRSPQNTNLWQGASGVNNPCPSGYRLPTDAELNAERQSWGSNNSAGAFASPLKLPVAGLRINSDGSLFNVGSWGYYWSSTVSGTLSRRLYFSSSHAYMGYNARAFGYSVRCLKD